MQNSDKKLLIILKEKTQHIPDPVSKGHLDDGSAVILEQLGYC